MKRPCQYGDDGEARGPTEEPNIQQTTLSDTRLNDFPAAFFLDPQVFHHYNMTIRVPRSLLPREISYSANIARGVSKRYFETIHSWFPILSRTKFYGHILQQSSQPDGELVFLVMCMQLVLSTPPESKPSPQCCLYTHVKRYFVDLEIAGLLTITVMQAGLLIAVYELGYGIYPAAHLTIGTCARYGVALGLDKEGSSWEHDSARWIEYEEKHRAWWAVSILDKYGAL